jgi:hypothetical protein
MRYRWIAAVVILMMSYAGSADGDEALSPREVRHAVSGSCHGRAYEASWSWSATTQNQERRIVEVSIRVDGKQALSEAEQARVIATINRWMVPETDRQSAPFLQYVQISCGARGGAVGYDFFLTRDYWRSETLDIVALNLPDGSTPTLPMTVFRSGRGAVSAETAELPAPVPN